MINDCREFERYLEASVTDSGRRLRFERHRESCPMCREQEEAHSDLSDCFAGLAPVRLSREFRPALCRRIATETPPRARRRVLVMQAYWLVAATISALILLLPDWQIHSDETVWRAGLLIIVISIALPAVMVAHCVNLGLVALISRTMSAPGRRL